MRANVLLFLCVFLFIRFIYVFKFSIYWLNCFCFSYNNHSKKIDSLPYILWHKLYRKSICQEKPNVHSTDEEKAKEETTIKTLNVSLAPVVDLFEPIKKDTKDLPSCQNHYENENLICIRLHSKNIPNINHQYINLVDHPDVHLEFQVNFLFSFNQKNISFSLMEKLQ